MDLFSDVKMLLLLLACLASSCGSPTGLANQGYNKNVQQQPSSLVKILKAVLVHESTGNGVHLGSVSSDSGVNFQVKEKNGYRAGTSVSTGNSYSAKTGLEDIRVFHKTHGDTWYNQPQVVREVPRGFSAYGGVTSKVDPDQALKSIHDLIFRPKPGQSFFGSSDLFRHETPKQSGYFYGAPRQQAGSGFAQTLNIGFTGGQYPSTGQTLNTGFATESLSNTGSVLYPSIGYQYSSSVRSQAGGFADEHPSNTFADAQSNSDHALGTGSAFESTNNAGNYPYVSPVRSQKAGFAGEHLSNTPSNSEHALGAGSSFESSNNVGSSSYSRPSQSGYSFSGSSASVLSLSEDTKGFKGFQHTSPAHAPKPEGFGYKKPVSMGYTYKKSAAADKVALLLFVSSLAQLNSENQGYRYEKAVAAQSAIPQGTYTVSNGYQYTAPPQSIVAPHRFEQLSNQSPNFYSPLKVNVADQPSNFNNFAPNFIGRHNFEQPQSYQNNGYQYDQSNKPNIAKSILKGQPYLPEPHSAAKDSSYPTAGYRYDKPDESSRSKTVFKGQPYLPSPYLLYQAVCKGCL